MCVFITKTWLDNKNTTSLDCAAILIQSQQDLLETVWKIDFYRHEGTLNAWMQDCIKV